MGSLLTGLNGISGLLFKQASIWHSTVVSSSNVNFRPVVTLDESYAL